MGHIECFVKAAESNFGMKPTETFQANDLYEGLKGNMINVSSQFCVSLVYEFELEFLLILVYPMRQRS